MTRAARIPLAILGLMLVMLVVLGLPLEGHAQPKPQRPYTLILDFVPTGNTCRTTRRSRKAGTGTRAST